MKSQWFWGVPSTGTGGILLLYIYVYMPSHRIEPTYGIWWGSPTKYEDSEQDEGWGLNTPYIEDVYYMYI